MGRIARNVASVDDAIHAYQTGQSMPEVCARFDLAHTTLYRALKRRGVPIRSGRLDLPPEVIDRYLAGESEKALAEAFEIDRGTVRKRLLDAGIERRGPKASSHLWQATLSTEQRHAQTAAAHDASRGRIKSREEMMKAAQTRASRGRPMSPGERILTELLIERGFDPRHETAIDRYNVDISLPGVAVEVLGGKWHAYKTIHRERTETILDAGWNLAFVWHDSRCPIQVGAAEQVVAFTKFTRRNPTARGEYRVIRGDGEVMARGNRQDDDFTGMPAPGYLTGRKRGRNERRPDYAA